MRTQRPLQHFITHTVNFEVKILVNNAEQGIPHATTHEIGPRQGRHIAQQACEAVRQVHFASLRDDFRRTRTSKSFNAPSVSLLSNSGNMLASCAACNSVSSR